MNLAENYNKTRKKTEDVCKLLQKEDFVVQPTEDISPPKWHLGHTSWFFEQFVLASFQPGYKPFNPHYNYIFNSYYESAGKRLVRADRGNPSRPLVDEVFKYRQSVDEQLLNLIENHGDDPVFQDIVVLGLHHEKQHQELLLTDIKYIFGHNPLFPVYQTSENELITHGSLGEKGVFAFEGGEYSMGHLGKSFGYDNEFPRHRVYLHPFTIANSLVTNADFLEFIIDGGYKNHLLWLADGWEWIKKHNINRPLYWHKLDGQWHYFTLRGLRPLDEHAPVCHVSYYEAEAFARWKGQRLPTEAEWEVAASAHAGNLNDANLLHHGNLMPLPGKKNQHQFLGDVWEWVSSAYLPYPGYKKPAGAIGEYNGKFMVNQMVLKGGSVATPEDHIRISYRNFFQPPKRWQFTGFRLANNI